MPIRKVTPSRAGVIIITAAIVSAINVVMYTLPNSDSYFDQEYYSLQDDLFLEKLLSSPIEQDDPALLKWVKEKIVKPSKEPYNLDYIMSGLHAENVLKSSQMYSPSQEFIIGQVEELLGDQLDRSGTYLEAGAYNGEFLSNTLALEIDYHWKGILVEANPRFFKKLLTKNRKAYAINACLNTKPWPSKELFVELKADNSSNHLVNGNVRNDELENQIFGGSSGLNNFVKISNSSENHETFTVQCIPIYTIIKALGLSHIDFLSLDVEGAEMKIFDTIPWDKVSFSIIAVEHLTLEDVREYLRTKGYIHVKSKEIDHIFVNKKITKIMNMDPAPPGEEVQALAQANKIVDQFKQEKIKIGSAPKRYKSKYPAKLLLKDKISFNN